VPIAIGAGVLAVAVVLVLVLYRARSHRRAARRVEPGDGQVNIEAGDTPVGRALSTADARLRQITDYVTRHRDSIGAEARARVDEAKGQLAAAHDKAASNHTEAIAHANGASRLAAQAQTLANADVQAAHRPPPRRGTASTR